MPAWHRLQDFKPGVHVEDHSIIGPVSRASGVVLAVLCGLAGLGGCTLPYQQLSLPDPIPPSGTTGALAQASRKPGVPLSAPAADAIDEPRIYKGTGHLAGSPAERPKAASETNDTVSLNLVEASIPEAAKSVLGDILGVNYIVSDKVKGSVTLQTTRAVPKDTLLETFEALLKAQGATMIVADGLYRVLPIEDAQAQGAPLRSQSSARQSPGQSTQILPLKYIAAAEMERIVRSVAPQAHVLRIDPVRNLLVVSGSRSEIASVTETVGVFDVDQMRGMSFAFFPLDSGDPEAIASELDVLFGNDRDGPGKGVVRFVPNKRMKAVLAIAPRVEHLERARTWVKRIDLAGRATEKQVHVYHVQNRPAAEVSQLLQRVYQSQEQPRAVTPTASPTAPRDVPVTLSQPQTLPTAGGSLLAGASTAGTAFEGSGPRAGQSGAPALAGANSGPVASLAGEGAAASLPSQAPAADVATGQRLTTGSVSGAPPDDRQTGISIVADEANNSLVITATAPEYRRLKQILERIDAAPNQVMLEATIAEVTLNDRLRFGLRWFFEKGASEISLTNSALGAVSPVFPGFSYFVNTPNVRVAINALSNITDVNVVSSPTLMVLDNKKAVLQVGDEVPIVTVQQQATIVTGAPILNAVSYRNTGVILSITPRVSDKGRVLLDIEQEVSDAVTTTSSDINAPTFQQRRVRTTVAVRDGEAIVLAGMMQDRATNSREAVPLLGQVPIVGNLFKNKDDTVRRTELLIAITPRVVKDDDQLRSIAAEFRDKLNFSTRPQRRAPPDKREQIDRLLR